MGGEHGRNGQWGGIPLRQLSLATLTFQNSALILVMHYSRIMPPVEGKRYLPSTAVFLNEIIKLAVSLTVALYDMSITAHPATPATTLFSDLFRNIFTGDSWKLAVPAILYTFQNTLQYVAVSNLDAATFQVTYQLKILTTAIFSVTMLRRSLTGRKWFSLFLLMVGVAIVQMPTSSEVTTFTTLKDAQAKLHVPHTFEELGQMGESALADVARKVASVGKGIIKRSGSYEGIEKDRGVHNPQLNGSIGLLAVVIACCLSGLAGVYFEKVLKDSGSKTTLWTRNCQLSFYSIFPSLFIGVIFKDGEQISKSGFFVGYNWVVWLAISLQAFGGLIVSLVVNYADNIAKNFATSISIVISFLASVWFFELKITANFVFGTVVVLFATYLYNSTAQPRLDKVDIAPLQKTIVNGEASFYENGTPRRSSLSTSLQHSPNVERTSRGNGQLSNKRED